MADFRKLILVLAIVALMAIPASAQAPLACQTVDAVPSLLRAEGITELVGNTVLGGCTNGTAQNISIQAMLGPAGANDTNFLLSTSPRTVNAYVIVGHADGVNDVFGPALVSADNMTLVWQNIELPVNEAPFSITITNVRVNAQALPLNTEVTENLFVAGTSIAPLPNNHVVVGQVYRGLFFSAEGTQSFPACIPHNQNMPDVLPEAPDFTISFEEGFANAFKTEADNSQNQAMEANPTLVAIGRSDLVHVSQGTELRARFTNIPAGVSIFVSAAPLSGTLLTEIGGETTGYVKLSVSGGTATAIWEVIGGADQAALQTADFGVVVSIPEGGIVVPGTGSTAPIVVNGSFAPLSTVFVPAGSTQAIPRFVDRFPTTNEAAISINACVTNLLFPYIVNTGNFDTGIALVNTSDSNFTGHTGTPADQPFNTVAQTGTCTMYFFGVNAPAAPVVTPQIGVDTNSTDAVNKHYYAFSLSAQVPGFLGYMIARCNFQFGHGYAFISDLGVTNWAQGYLALVIPDLSAKSQPRNARSPQPFPEAGPGSGEQLGN